LSHPKKLWETGIRSKPRFLQFLLSSQDMGGSCSNISAENRMASQPSDVDKDPWITWDIPLDPPPGDPWITWDIPLDPPPLAAWWSKETQTSADKSLFRQGR